MFVPLLGSDDAPKHISNLKCGCANAATSGRLMQARTDLLLTIVEQLQKEGVLYSLAPYQDGNTEARRLPEDADPNVQPQDVRNDVTTH